MGECFNCPFFISAKANSISCEIGKITPPDEQTTREFKQDYCAHIQNYQQCTCYKVLNKYYERKYNK